MGLRVSSVVIDSVDPRLVAEFWCEVLGYQIVDEDATGVSIESPEHSGPVIDILLVPEAKSIKNRLHLDLRAEGSTTEAELTRLYQLGARQVDVGQGPDVSWVVLADPEGNEFCLLSRTVEEVAADL
jgi:catechol-2,3-dioxygenase